MKRILFVFPTSWDEKQLAACRPAWQDRYEVVFGEPTDVDCPGDLDPTAWLDEMAERWGGDIHGVTSSSDYPGATLAAALAQRLGLPGSPPQAVLRASHKYYARVAQRECVPQATPAFDLVPATLPVERDPATGYPCFVKPIKGAFSVMSGKVRSRDELQAFLGRASAQEFLTGYVSLFNDLVARLTDFEIDGSRLLAEEFLRGRQVTVEGFVRGGSVDVLGVVDSILHPGVPSFARFDFPSVRRLEIQEEMAEIARCVVPHLGLDETMFNIEMIYEPATDRLDIVEINPRLCGQFGDLYQKVLGVSGYEIALALAAGDPLPSPAGAPPPTGHGGGAPNAGRAAPAVRGPYAMATSFPLRTFTPVRVARAPTAEDVAAAEALFDGTLVWIECETGAELSDFEAEDGWSSRYAVVNLGADSRAELRARLDAVTERLDIRFEPVER